MCCQVIDVSVGVRNGSVNDFLITVAAFSFSYITPYCTWQGVQLIPTQLGLCRQATLFAPHCLNSLGRV